MKTYLYFDHGSYVVLSENSHGRQASESIPDYGQIELQRILDASKRTRKKVATEFSRKKK